METKLKKYARIYFQDNGQDTLWWDIDAFGKVIGCGPFQGRLWKQFGVKLSTVRLGGYLEIFQQNDKPPYPLRVFRHKIKSIGYFQIKSSCDETL